MKKTTAINREWSSTYVQRTKANQNFQSHGLNVRSAKFYANEKQIRIHFVAVRWSRLNETICTLSDSTQNKHFSTVFTLIGHPNPVRSVTSKLIATQLHFISKTYRYEYNEIFGLRSFISNNKRYGNDSLENIAICKKIDQQRRSVLILIWF